ncbi:hypothetical protein LCGC14_3100120 [marine sediment metagenome]|uniref:Uncharacterized protein n=1 Tax=marine sediment metagenome TaxID=412755 RepID=A0A0F8YFJ8_9ZZZZ
MNYAIICDARQGWKHGINVLALVNRGKTKKLWWTSDDTGIIMKFIKKSAADLSCKKLFMNNCRVVDYRTAYNRISKQDNDITDSFATADMELGWDSHKH